MTKRGPRPRGFNAIDLSGQRFGRLVVLDRSESAARIRLIKYAQRIIEEAEYAGFLETEDEE